MKCPHCQHFDTKVIDSRLNQVGDSTRRRRECPECKERFTTYETIEAFIPMIVKKDGRRELFNREKLRSGIEKACQKRAISTSKIDEMIEDIEKSLGQTGSKEIAAKQLGNLVMEALLKIDKVAYVRFASVYREFQDVDEFVAEINKKGTDTTK